MDEPFVWANRSQDRINNFLLKSDDEKDKIGIIASDKTENDVLLTGYVIDLLIILKNELDFIPQIKLMEKYGKFKDNKWNGMIKSILDNKADFAMSAMTITPQRENYVDFTQRYMDYSVSVVMRKPKAKTTLFSILEPFKNEVWQSLILCWTVVSLLLFVLNKTSPKRMKGPRYHDTSLHGTLWFVYSCLVQQSTDMYLVTASTQIVTGVW